MTYKDRPGASPVVAALFAVGEIDSLALNNVAQRPRARPAYAAEVARVLEPGGLLVLQVRQDRGFNSVGYVEEPPHRRFEEELLRRRPPIPLSSCTFG